MPLTMYIYINNGTTYLEYSDIEKIDDNTYNMKHSLMNIRITKYDDYYLYEDFGYDYNRKRPTEWFKFSVGDDKLTYMEYFYENRLHKSERFLRKLAPKALSLYKLVRSDKLN